MRAVGIKLLKNRLSEYVRVASAGEVVLVLDRERVVAELHPPAESRPLRGVDAWMAEQVRQGNITPSLTATQAPPPSFGLVPRETMLHDLEQDRGDR